VHDTGTESTGSTGNTAQPSRRTVLAATAGAAGALAAAGPAYAAGAPDDKQLRALVLRMTLEEKVGQLFVMRVYGHSATAPDQADIDANLKEIGVRTAAELVAKYRVGGIIYFAWAHNTREPHQIADLSNGIQRASLDLPRGLPVLISTDQEHGIVARVGEPATLFPGAMAVGAGGSRSDARALGRIAGRELRAMGIRQDYSPVADVNVNPANPVIGVRSFGADPRAVAALVAAEVAGYQGSGVAATAKHFPGHGDTNVDSHTGFPTITHSRELWEKLDAPPFRAAIAAGIDSIMTAHLMVPALDDSGDPATLSRPILTGILRERLGYDGVVVTDSLGMEGVRTKYGDDRVPVLALKAGVDQLLNPPDLDLAWHAVLDAVRNGELTEARLDESILRILRLKAKLGLFRAPYVSRSGGRQRGAAAAAVPAPVPQGAGGRGRSGLAVGDDRAADRSARRRAGRARLHHHLPVDGHGPVRGGHRQGGRGGAGRGRGGGGDVQRHGGQRSEDAGRAARGDGEAGRGGRDPQPVRRGPPALRPGVPRGLLLDRRGTAGRRTGDRGTGGAPRETPGGGAAGG
jgi:beta-N-acetylhexosaminidase